MKKANDSEFLNLLNEYLKTIHKFAKYDIWDSETSEPEDEGRKGTKMPDM